MTRRLMLGFLFACCVSISAQAQTVSDAFVESLNKQGFVIQSIGYTWLWRTLVLATDGTHEREIVIARGSGQILQDNWSIISTVEDSPSASNGTGSSPSEPATGKGRNPEQPGKSDTSDGPGGHGGPGGPGGHGGPGGPGGHGGPSGPGGPGGPGG